MHQTCSVDPLSRGLLAQAQAPLNAWSDVKEEGMGGASFVGIECEQQRGFDRSRQASQSMATFLEVT